MHNYILDINMLDSTYITLQADMCVGLTFDLSEKSKRHYKTRSLWCSEIILIVQKVCIIILSSG